MPGPWTLPSTWHWSTAGELMSIVGGGTPQTSDASMFEEGGIPWVTPADLSGYSQKYISRGSRSLSRRGLEHSSARLLPRGAVLFSSRAPIGYVAIAANDMATNQGFKSLIPPSSIDSEFLYYYLIRARELAQELASGTTFAELSGRKMASLPIPVVPKPEQLATVSALDSYLSRLDAVTATLEQVQRNLKRYRASVLKAAVEGRLVPTAAEVALGEGRSYAPASELLERVLADRRARWVASGKKGKYKEPVPPDATALPPLPGGWCWTRLEQLAEVSGGLTKNARREGLPSRVPYLRVANVYADELRLDDVSSIGVATAELDRVLLRKNDLLMVEGNGSADQIGRVALWDGSISPCVHQNHIIKARFVDPAMARWAMVWLSSIAGRTSINRVASSTSGLHTLSISKVASLPIPLAPLAEQERITVEVARQQPLLASIGASVARELARTRSLRSAILRSAFRGELV